jgi:membrane protease YdiL (CAAX protease family)
MALTEVIACSGFPTQVALGAALMAAGFAPVRDDGILNVEFVVLLSLLDTLAIAALVVFFLRSYGEPLGAVFLGEREISPEVRAGILMTPLVLLISAVVMLTIQLVAPWLRTVDRNPLQDLIRTPGDIAVFAIVVVLAGGVREEIQRGFVLHRFEQSLGGKVIGVLVASIAFGAGHLVQGGDAAVTTAILGALWGVLYLRRRSIVAAVVSHSCFNLLQLAQFAMLGR